MKVVVFFLSKVLTGKINSWITQEKAVKKGLILVLNISDQKKGAKQGKQEYAYGEICYLEDVRCEEIIERMGFPD